MIPELNENGLLPPGIHECTIIEVQTKFAYNNRRREIFSGLLLLIKDLKTIFSTAVYLDGSFVTSKVLPNDIDVCWDEGTGTKYQYEFVQMPILFNRDQAKLKYKADVFPANFMESGSQILFIDFFQEDKTTGERKGILKINII